MRDATPLGSASGALPDPAASATVVVDARGIVTGWSAGAERLLGYTHRTAVGRPVLRLLGVDTDTGADAYTDTGTGADADADTGTGTGANAGADTGTGADTDADADADTDAGADTGAGEGLRAALGGRDTTTRLRHRDGRYLEFRLRAYPWFDGEGRARQVLVATPPEHPRTDPVTAQEAFAQCHLPVMVYDRALRAVRASAGAERELGMSEEEMSGRRVTDILPPHICHAVEDGMRRVSVTGETEQFHVRGRARAGDRERVWAITVSPIRGPAGRVSHLELSALDVTEQQLARERIALLNDISARVGSTLDVRRTAQEMADAVVGRLADFVTVDLLDSLLRGVEPAPSATGAVTLRREAQQSVLPGVPEALLRPGDADDYPESSPPVRCLATGRPSLHRTIDDVVRTWRQADPGRAGVVESFGIHSLMVVPLRARGIALGVAVLVRHRREEPFTEDDLLLAEEIGTRAAVAVDNARRYTLERNTALALQRSLLPSRLAAQGAVDVAYRYLPARTRAGLGGDWFDVIPLSGARVALVVGDVVGHGLRASATMGRLRTAVRTLADVDLPADELLTQLDDLVTHVAAEEETATAREPDADAEPDTEADAVGVADAGVDASAPLIATCLYVVYDPVSRRCTATAAGHPPPAFVTPAGVVDFADLRPGPPLGVGGLPFETVEWELPPGSLLVLYTDGLVQGEEHDLGSGLALLRACLERPAPSLEATCDHVIRTLLPERPQDDAALLLARTRALDAAHVAVWDLPSDPAAVAGARAKVLDRLAAWRLEDVAFTAELVVSELVTNAIRYGRPPIRLRLIREAALICEVSDGSGTAPHLRRARTFDEGGRGLLLVAQFAQRWGTRQHAGGKSIWAEIELPGHRA
ncbi:SpoIIE family protein phosphatase [Streptomyces sp. NPDC101213]|uniref:ATP-binding SpoIIE family protein phosphatase n=1 Tax=Streptomyces sp. NPDC101213 TaxID=3366130 RepID=UPI00380A3FA1